MPALRLDGLLAAGYTSARADPRPDAELLDRFLTHRDEAAFEAIVVRHTPTLRAVCRGWLADPADIDDAVQATFLVLVRRPEGIRNRGAVGGWLCGVAENVARRLKATKARSRPLDEIEAPDVADDDGVAEAIRTEVARLPEKYRRPIQLCYLAGLTAERAAELLDCPRGTVLTRLDRGKKLLQRRLAARGLAPTVLLGAVLGRSGAVNPWWVWGTARAAKALLAGATVGDLGIPARTLTLTEGMVHAMIWNKLKMWAAAALLATTFLGFGLGRWANASPSDDERRGPRTAGPAVPGESKPSQAVSRYQDPALPAVPASDTPIVMQDAVLVDAGVNPPAAPAAGVPGKRREAVIRLPVGTFTKEIEVAPYGSCRVTWTYGDETVTGTIAATVMGGELEIKTEAEYSLSSNGTIYGILTGFKVTHVKLPQNEGMKELAPYVGLWPLIEPLVAEVFTDMPFSYQFRMQGDRLVITHYRALLAGPNPFGKVGALLAAKGAGDNAAQILAAFQALSVLMEGAYEAVDPDRKEQPKSGPRFSPGGKSGDFKKKSVSSLPSTEMPPHLQKGAGLGELVCESRAPAPAPPLKAAPVVGATTPAKASVPAPAPPNRR